MKKVLSLLLIAVFVFLTIPAVAPVTEAASESSLRDQIAQSQAKQAELEQQLKDAQNKKKDYLDQKEIVEQQVGELQSQINYYDSLIAGLDADIKAMEAEISDCQKVYDENVEKYKAQARATYEQGEVSYLDVLFGSQSFSDFLLRLSYVKQVSLYQKDLQNSLVDSIKTIKKNISEVEVKRSEQVSARKDVADRKAVVDAKEAEIQSLVNKAKATETSIKNALDKEAKNEDKLNDMLQAELSGGSSPDISFQEGEWLWPVARASYNYISSGYGWRTLYGKRSFHYAIDIAAPRNTPIYASKAGKVITSGWGTLGAGYHVKIDHGNGFVTIYYHMNSMPPVKVGQYVQRGQVIGYVGMTGGTSTGYHLDIRFYVNGSPQNPLNYLKYPY